MHSHLTWESVETLGWYSGSAAKRKKVQIYLLARDLATPRACVSPMRCISLRDMSIFSWQSAHSHWSCDSVGILSEMNVKSCQVDNGRNPDSFTRQVSKHVSFQQGVGPCKIYPSSTDKLCIPIWLGISRGRWEKMTSNTEGEGKLDQFYPLACFRACFFPTRWEALHDMFIFNWHSVHSHVDTVGMLGQEWRWTNDVNRVV